MQEIKISSRRPIELIDITDRIQQVVSDSKMDQGLCYLFVPHATAGIIINENETGLIKDFEKILKITFKDFDFEHNRIDNNAHSHLLAGFIGPDVFIPFEKQKLQLGRWQQIFFIELDGPRSRRNVLVSLIQNN